MNKLIPSWQEFEIAVASFIKAIDPNASVTHNAHTPDADTGSPRQRDVWIVCKLCNLFTVNILVSCKHYDRKLNELDIDHFIGELKSSKADKGVIYSYKGFNKRALKKAKANNIPCLKLFINEPPNIPNLIVIPDTFCCYPRFQLSIESFNDPNGKFKTWNDIFSLKSDKPHIGDRIIDYIFSILSEGQSRVMDQMKDGNPFPANWSYRFSLKHPSNDSKAVIIVSQFWDIFQAKLEAHIVNGSYSFTDEKFVGEIRTPYINTIASEPGLGWIKCLQRPDPSIAHVGMALFFGDIKQNIMESFGSRELSMKPAP